MSETPGQSIHNILLAQNISIETFAKRVGLALPDAQKLLDGEFVIDLRLALELARACGNDATYWLEREKTHRTGGTQT